MDSVMNSLGLRLDHPAKHPTNPDVDNNRNHKSSASVDGIIVGGIATSSRFQTRGRRSVQGMLMVTAAGMVLGVFFLFMLREQGIKSLAIDDETLDIKGEGPIEFDPLEPPRRQPFPKSLPSECSRSQMVQLRKVFSEEGCLAAPHLQECSFTKATTGRGHTLPYYIDYWKSQAKEGSSFLGIFMECALDPTAAVGSLYLGTANESYNLQTFLLQYSPSDADELFQKSVWKDLGRTHASSTPSPGIVYCFGSPSEKMSHLIEVTDQLGWGNNNEFVLRPNDHHQMPLDRLSISLPHLNEGRAIHILHLASPGYDSELLSGAQETLPYVEYLEFQYTWRDPWSHQKFKDAIDFLAYKDFACYWNGKEGNLWRITGCWLDFYEHHHWSMVNCVNSKRAPQLLEIMENVFERTLEKEFQF